MKPGLLKRVANVFWESTPKTPQRRENFTGAALSRLLSNWVTIPLSADREIENDLTRLRARCRELARNQPYARRYMRLCRNHIVGPMGLQCFPRNAFENGKPYETLNDTIAAAWKEWGTPRYCSTNKRLSWLAMQRLAISEWATGGEFLCLLHLDRASKYGLRLQPIDADRLDDQFHRKRDLNKNENEIRFGVEVDPLGAAVAYHILNRHPNDIGSGIERSRYRDRIAASQVIHLYVDDERVERSRGVSDLAVSARDLRHVDGFQEAALVQARTAAASMGFIVTKSPDGEPTTPEEGLEFAAEAGVIRELGMGQEFQEWNPNQPSDTYATFTKSVLRAIAAGLGVSYATLANDLSDANYSSMRVGRNEEQEHWQSLQQWFIEQFCQRVYDAWLENAVLFGGLTIPNADLEKARTVEWIPRRWISADPVKDGEADHAEVALGTTSRQEIAARSGKDLWKIMEQIAEEEAYAKDLGINVAPNRKAGAATDAKENGTMAPDDEAMAGGGGPGGAGEGAGRSTHPAFAVVRSAS